MPNKVNEEKADLSVSIGKKIRARLVAACSEDEISLTQATREAISNWLSARERKKQREKAEKKD